ncbi:hypothetical protein TRVL_09540 [Trypanosoma vivax]|nr:hypothetical protein TRVL_09540 [Trypanosoma vivax]
MRCEKIRQQTQLRRGAYAEKQTNMLQLIAQTSVIATNEKGKAAYIHYESFPKTYMKCGISNFLTNAHKCREQHAGATAAEQPGDTCRQDSVTEEHIRSVKALHTINEQSSNTEQHPHRHKQNCILHEQEMPP